MHTNASTYFYGFSLGLSLILAIGAQNAFVLKQGLKGEHVFWVSLTCAASDAVLIAAGVSGFHGLILRAPWLESASRYAGAAFLLWYGGRSLLGALKSSSALHPMGADPATIWQTLAACLAFTFLNPHVYLDTLLLIGSVSTQFPGHGFEFGLGAASASFVFFFALGYGARLLRPLFQKPRTWQALDLVIGLTMWSLAYGLLRGS